MKYCALFTYVYAQVTNLCKGTNYAKFINVLVHEYTLSLCRGHSLAGVASEAGNAGSSRAPGLTSGLQGSVNVHRGALLLVPQWQCISSFVFYIEL